jgi:predicted TPR repeat methyltransferase
VTIPAQALEHARYYENAGNLSLAELLCRQALDADPDNVDALVLLGYLCQVQARLPESLSIYQRALQIDPNCAEAHNNMGFLYAAQGDLERAGAAYERALAAKPNHADALNNLGILHVRRERLADAARYFEQAVRARPEFAQAISNLGHVHLLQRQSVEAARCYREVLRRRPNDTEAYHQLAVAATQEQHWDEAAAAWQRSLAINPDDPRTLRNLGFALLRQAKHADALACYRRALKLIPDDHEVQILVDALVNSASWARVPADYVTAVFDWYADSFERDLCDNLGYRGPELLLAAVGPASEPRSLDVLDLGCGTGLCGAAFRATARTLTGIDLSANMLAKADARGCYDRLIRGDLLAVVEASSGAFDLVMAGDVLIYQGDLAPLAQGVRRALRPGGRFAFTVERHEGCGYLLRPTTLRFAHSRDYLHELAGRAAMQEVTVQDAVIRTENGEPVAGLVVVWAVPAHGP